MYLAERIQFNDKYSEKLQMTPNEYAEAISDRLDTQALQAVVKKPPEEWHCLYVEALDELFTESVPSDEVHEVMSNLNTYLQQCIELNKPFFLDFQRDKEIELAINAQFGNSHSFLRDAFLAQKEWNFQPNQGHYMQRRDTFFQYCLNQGLKTIRMGGVYGGACVWGTAESIGNSIYAQILPNFTHPNLRIHYYTNPFDTVVIDPAITEGCSNSKTSKKKQLRKWVEFPGLWVVDDLYPELKTERSIKEDISNAMVEFYDETFCTDKRLLKQIRNAKEGDCISYAFPTQSIQEAGPASTHATSAKGYKESALLETFGLLGGTKILGDKSAVITEGSALAF